MKNSKLILYSLLSSLGLILYVTLVACFMTNANKIFGSVPEVSGVAAFLLLFVFSALITGLLVLGGPVYLYLEGDKKSAFKMLGFNALWIIIIIILLLVIRFDFDKKKTVDGNIDQLIVENFADCVEAGNPVMESYPRQCRHEDKTYTENIGNEMEKMDLIRLDSPRPNQYIDSPVTIQGEARGTWFFEGDFPVVLTDWDGLIIAEGYATAKSDGSTDSPPSWMTEDFVRFEAELEFQVPAVYNRGSLILRKDNPSGMPEHDDALEVPVYFNN